MDAIEHIVLKQVNIFIMLCLNLGANIETQIVLHFISTIHYVASIAEILH